MNTNHDDAINKQGTDAAEYGTYYFLKNCHEIVLMLDFFYEKTKQNKTNKSKLDFRTQIKN